MRTTAALIGSSQGWIVPASGSPLPIWSLTLALLACFIVPASPLSQLLQFERSALAAGELWRLITCHWTHFNNEQLFWDVLAFVGFAAVCERQSRSAFFLCLLSAALVVPLAVWLTHPEILIYRGISGLDVALFLCAACTYFLDNFGRQKWLAAALAGMAITIFLGKTCFEFASQSTLFVQQNADFIPIPLAHLAGGLSGCLSAFAAFKITRAA